MSWLFSHWGKAFWILFVATAVALFFMGRGLGGTMVDLFFWLMIIILGTGKLSEEFFDRKLMRYQDDIYKKIHQVSKQLEQTFELANRGLAKADHRFFRISTISTSMKKDLQKDSEKKYRELVRKIIEVENNMNKLARVVAEKQKPVFRPVITGSSFEELVIGVVKRIPAGSVTTYNEITKLLGKPRSAQIVGQILKKPKYRDLPLHRVVRSDGYVGSYGSMTEHEVNVRKMLLRKEGVEVSKDRVADMKRYVIMFS
jgi:methylated-DNA-protein-cysteine methyltransferase-like protein